MTRRSPLAAIALALLGCGAGELHPFATGPGAEGQADGSGDSADTEPSADDPLAPRGIAYVRCPRTTTPLELEGDVVVAGTTTHATRTLGYADVYDALPRVGAIGGFAAPCDLVLRTDDGEETVLFDCTATASPTRTCAAIQPAVSHDGRHLAFSVVSGAIEHPSMQAYPWLLDPAAQDGDQAWLELPNPVLAATDAELHVLDLVTGEDVLLPHVEGTFDGAPTFLADGRIAFTSTRAGDEGTAVHVGGEPWNISMVELVPQLHTVAIDGRDLRRIGVHGLGGEFDPVQLVDGRLAFVSRQLFGMLPYRYTNGSPGSPGAIGSSYHVYAEDPDGARLTPLFGQHTHILAGSDYSHVASQGPRQASDGRLWVGEVSGPFGAGTIYGFHPRDDGLEGIAPDGEHDAGDVLRPDDLANIVAWAGRSAQFSAPTPAPAVELPGYDDPLVHRGFVRDPEALPHGGMLLTWTKGACSDVATAHEELFGDPEPPHMSGSGAFTAMNALDYLGLDTPGCDAGIYRLDHATSEHPSDLALVVDREEFHEIMPRVVGPYAEVHGVTPAIIPAAEERADEPELLPGGTPFALFGAASLLLRETRSVDGHPFGGEIQWALQGTDTSDYSDDDVCGLRLLAVQPNRPETDDPVRVPAGLRTLVLAEVPARKRDADGDVVLDASGLPDTSVRLSVPADVAMLVQGIDCDGRTLSTSQTPLSLRPGEDLRCDGCHVRSEPGLPFADTAAARADAPMYAAGTGSVQLLAGVQDDDVVTESVAGWGIAYEFERDVWPILQSRCVACHGGDTPAAGLPLDRTGIDAGSTWWQLVADGSQSLVPAALRVPDGALHKPQLTRYVRFMAARGSLLYWKAANARTDGRTDDLVPDDAGEGIADVDFGADHPTEITAGELAVIGRWIDTGAAAGAGVLADDTPPTVSLVRDADDATRVRIGTVDVGAGIDASSLEVCRVAAGGSCSAIATAPAAEAGLVEIAVPGGDVELRVRVMDHAGNETLVQRSFATDDPMPDDADSPTGSDDGGDAVPGAEHGCGCGSAPPIANAFALLVLLACRRRR